MAQEELGGEEGVRLLKVADLLELAAHPEWVDRSSDHWFHAVEKWREGWRVHLLYNRTERCWHAVATSDVERTTEKEITELQAAVLLAAGPAAACEWHLGRRKA